MEPTPPPFRAVYMDLQPDWHAQRPESCWLNVFERTLRFCDGERPRVAVESRLNASFQLPMAPDAAASDGKANAAHLVEIARAGRDWMEVRAASSAGGQEDLARVVFQAPRGALDVFAPPRHPPSLADGTSREVEPVTSRRVARPQLLSVDVSCDEKFVVCGGAEGACALWDVETDALAGRLDGHLLDVTKTRFFPSGKVVLTASLDFTLRIWSVDSARCAAVLKGHRGGVTDVAVVGRGRNVVSSATDGAVHLWCCANQQVVAAWNNEDKSAAQCVALLDDATLTAAASTTGENDQSDRENEFETESKVLFAGLENGQVLAIDVRARELALDLRATAAATACAATSCGGAPTLLTGSEDGVLAVWDLRQPSAPLRVLSRSSAAIHRIVVPGDDRGSVWTAQGDGSSSNWSHVLGGGGSAAPPCISTELTGPQYDPVRDLAVGAATGRVFTACRDGLVRDYIPHFLG